MKERKVCDMEDKNIDDLQETEVTDVEQTTEELQDQIEQQDKDLDDAEKKKDKLKRRVKARNIVILILTLIIIILLLVRCSDNGVNFLKNTNVETTDFKEWNTENEKKAKESGHVDVFVMGDCALNKDNPYLAFGNPKSNAGKYYLQFELYDNGSDKYFYQSDMVESTKDGDYKFSVDMTKLLSKGTHKVLVKTRAFDYKTMSECNGASQTITVTIQ